LRMFVVVVVEVVIVGDLVFCGFVVGVFVVVCICIAGT